MTPGQLVHCWDCSGTRRLLAVHAPTKAEQSAARGARNTQHACATTPAGKWKAAPKLGAPAQQAAASPQALCGCTHPAAAPAQPSSLNRQRPRQCGASALPPPPSRQGRQCAPVPPTPIRHSFAAARRRHVGAPRNDDPKRRRAQHALQPASARASPPPRHRPVAHADSLLK